MTSSVVDRGHRVTFVPYQRQFKGVLAYAIKCSRSLGDHDLLHLMS
jgi:hypothetical protein